MNRTWHNTHKQCRGQEETQSYVKEMDGGGYSISCMAVIVRGGAITKHQRGCG